MGAPESDRGVTVSFRLSRHRHPLALCGRPVTIRPEGGSGFEGCCLLSRQLFEGSIGYFLYYSPGDPPLEGSTVRHDPIPYGPYSESQRRLPRDVDLLISDVDLHRRHGQSPHLG